MWQLLVACNIYVALPLSEHHWLMAPKGIGYDPVCLTSACHYFLGGGVNFSKHSSSAVVCIHQLYPLATL